HERFEAATTRQIIAAPEIPHAQRFLRSVRRNHRTGLLSSTPQELLAEIVTRRGWAGYFDAVQGAPVRKAQWLEDLRSARGWGRGDLIFFGDQEEDARAAEEAGCLFVGVGGSFRPCGKESLWISDYGFWTQKGEELS
ncbi:MAG: HAD family hydrolase, partial [Candidatus Omnitrophica bacterium]|nr:HAD family hydrolase [Candidatus Omnitrophota bacterium]